MIAIARGIAPHIDFRVEPASKLASIDSESIDLVVSNYVLMDTPLLEGTLRAFHRVLKPRGTAVVVFSHPCFPQGHAETMAEGAGVRYTWESSYFEPRKCSDPPWGHFSSSFIWFHRPLSDYWKAFVVSGFDIVDFEEPRISTDRYALAAGREMLSNYRERPYSVAFKLRRRNAESAEKPL
jgi:SAM-dependent methyltransferase